MSNFLLQRSYRCIVVPLLTDPTKGHKFSAETLQHILKKTIPSSSPIVLILNSPCNPTGAIYSASELQGITDICRQYNVLLLYDGIYAQQLDFHSQTMVIPSVYYPEGTITIGGMSKIFAGGGKRIGFMHVPSNLPIKQALITFFFFLSESISCVDTCVQHATADLFTEHNMYGLSQYINNTRRINATPAKYVSNRLRKMKLSVYEPDGAFYIFPSFDDFHDVLSAREIKSGKKKKTAR